MSIKRRAAESSKTPSARIALSCVLVVFAVLASLTLLGGNALQNQPPSSSGHQLVVLLDLNANQRKVLPVEQMLARGVIEELDRPVNVFSVITFGSEPPALLKSSVHADEAIAAVRDVRPEPTGTEHGSPHLYDALNLAFGQFTLDARAKSLLIITEGNDYARAKVFKHTVSRAQQLHASCDVALVADHTFYGSKAIQRYGFYLRELAGKTRAQYVEVGAWQKKVPPSVDRISKSILAQGQD